MEIKKQMSADPNGCYVVDMMPNLRFLVQSSELVKNPKEEMESFENEYPVSFAINFDNPPERLTKEHANSKNSQSGTQAVPGTKSDEADYGRTKRRATLFQNSVRPFINYFLQSDRLVNVDVSSGALDLVWEKICSIFLELNFRNRFNVNSVIIFSFDGEHMDSIELGKYSLRHINLKDHLQDPVDSQENVCSTLCGVIDGSDPTVEVFLVNLEGTSINKQMKFETMDNLKSTKGKTKIVHEGYIYVKQKNLANGVISYECELRKNGKHASGQCKAKIKEGAVPDRSSHDTGTGRRRWTTTMPPVQGCHQTTRESRQ
ncbi:uncharacterized protein LOC121382324 isoform X1 [Gigantopelta aegis]|uniref:uncharacterized protein LOC121382324 isoform X1 n=1 Tax=Gigantopelta aegis TaxID=1735272 RepID=UPI001B88D2DC|nr:uncharacterized protein LOC121382324 isoform X1 [Gigantopelta aegis]